MNTDEIINRALTEKGRWFSKGYQNGKYIIGIDVKNKLMTSAEYGMYGTIQRDTLMGFEYVIDYQNPNDINFCPIGE